MPLFKRRPTSLPGLIAYLITLRVHHAWQRSPAQCIAIPLAVLLGLGAGTIALMDDPQPACDCPGPAEASASLDMAHLASLETHMVALHALPEGHEDLHGELAQSLGDHWQMIDAQPLGLIIDTEHYTLLSSTLRDETHVYDHGSPTLEVRLRCEEGNIHRVFVASVAPAMDGQRRARQAQFDALRSLAQEGIEAGERVVILGDFHVEHNGQSRDDLVAFSHEAYMSSAIEDADCIAHTSSTEHCEGYRYDHALTWLALP